MARKLLPCSLSACERECICMDVCARLETVELKCSRLKRQIVLYNVMLLLPTMLCHATLSRHLRSQRREMRHKIRMRWNDGEANTEYEDDK